MSKLVFALALMVGASAASAAEPDGAALFATHCASCHGVNAEGDGRVAPLMNIAVPNLRTLTQRSGGTFPTEAVAAYIDGRTPAAPHGSRTMPVWGDFLLIPGEKGGEELVRARIAALVEFIRQLQYR